MPLTVVQQPETVPLAIPCRGFVAELILESAGGNRVAFGRLFDLFHGAVDAAARRTLPDGPHHEAETNDAVADCFVQLWLACPAYVMSTLDAVGWVRHQIRSYEETR